MAKVEQWIIEKIKDEADCVEVVSDFVTLRKTGVNYTGLCPFHNDEHDGNFIVRPKNVKDNPNTYHCFKCMRKGEGGGPIDFLMKSEHMSFMDALRYLGKKYSIEVDNVPVNYTPPPPRPKPKPLPTWVMPRRLVAARIDNQGDTFCTWVRHLPWAPEQRARVEEMLKLYCVGHATVRQEWNHQEHHFTVFWQIDAAGNPRTGHYMKYQANGKRIKDKKVYNTDWFHAILSRHWDAEKRETSYEAPYPYPDIYNPATHTARQCLFGEHLLNRYPNAPVCIVESETTAVLMAIAYGNHQLQVWMACSGIGNLTRDKLKPIIDQRRRIILYPDKDGVDDWREKASLLEYDRIVIDTRAIDQWWKPEDGPKADIADVVIRIIREAAEAKSSPDTPQLNQLIDKLNLEPIKQ